MADTYRINKITSSRVKDRGPTYTDFYINFNKHPETGKLMLNNDAEAIKKALRALIMTFKGERFYDPDKGSNIRRALFEQFSDQTTDLLKTYIREAIENYEPRVNLLEVLVTPFEEQNLYRIAVIFEMTNSTSPITLTLTLERIR